MTDICERLVRFAGKVCVSTDTEVEAADTIEALRAENAKLRDEHECLLKSLLYFAGEHCEDDNALRTENTKLLEALNGLMADYYVARRMDGFTDLDVRGLEAYKKARAAIGETDG